MRSNVTSAKCQPLVGMVHQHAGTNRGAWLQIAAALDKHPQRDLFTHARSVAALAKADAAVDARSAAAAVADSQAIPVGNHGDNRTSIK